MLHLDPAPESSGGGAPPVQQQQPPAQPPPPPPPPPAAPATLTLTVDEYQRLKAFERQMGEAEVKQRQESEVKEQARLKALADKGEAEKALEQQRTSYEAKVAESDKRYGDLRHQYLSEKKSNVIGDALSGVKFVSEDAARQARMILDAQFDAAFDSAGVVTVKDRTTGRAASDVIKELVAGPTLAHFLEPSSRGGGGVVSGGAQPTATPEGSQSGVYDSAAIIRDFQQRVQVEAQGQAGLWTVGRRNPASMVKRG